MTPEVGSPPQGEAIRSTPQPRCPLCNEPGEPSHSGVRDRLFGAPGIWSFRACSNRGCGALWLDPMPLVEDLHLAYGRYYTHERRARGGWLRRWYEAVRQGYYARRFGYRIRDPLGVWRLSSLAFQLTPGRREMLDLSVMMLDRPEPGARCLDVGCGDATQLEILRGLGWVTVGVDLDPLAVSAAAARGIDVRRGRLEDQGFQAASFEAVFSNHVIEHVPCPGAWLSECRRLLVPGGRLLIITPNADSMGHARFGPRWRGLEPPRHLQIFTPRAMARVARAAGFERIEVKTIARMAATIHLESVAPETRNRGLRDHLAAMTLVIQERMTLRNHPDIGEEILLRAWAPGDEAHGRAL